MCLVCGEVVCSQSYCCQADLDGTTMVGAATLHASQCGAGTGIFLRYPRDLCLFHLLIYFELFDVMASSSTLTEVMSVM